MWSDWLVFCDCGFQSVCPLMEKDKRLMEASWWERLTEGETGSCSDGWGHAQKIFNPVLCWWLELPPCYLPGSQTMVEVMKIMAASFKRPHAHTATPSAPDPAAGHHRPSPLPETPGHSWTSLGQSLVGSLLLSPGSWCTQGSVCVLQESISPVLCKFWQLLVTSSKRA